MQLVAATELIQGIPLCLHNSPEPFHWAIIDAIPNAGHGLLHTLIRELELERFTGILEPPVTVEQRVCFRIFANCLLKCVKHQLVVIASAYDVGDNRPVIEIEDGAQIELLNDRSFVPFEFCHVRCPLLVRSFCQKIPVKDVL